MTMFDREMQRALLADAQKLRDMGEECDDPMFFDTADEYDDEGNLIPRDGTVIPTRSEFAALLQRIAEEAETGEGVPQPLAERFAQYLDAIYAALPASTSDTVAEASGENAPGPQNTSSLNVASGHHEETGP